jgi:hypothetical protein
MEVPLLGSCSLIIGLSVKGELGTGTVTKLAQTLSTKPKPAKETASKHTNAQVAILLLLAAMNGFLFIWHHVLFGFALFKGVFV